MAVVVVYNPSDPQVINKVSDFLPSANTPSHQGNPNTLINPDLSLLWSAPNTFIVPLQHWKYDGSSDIVEMTQPEKDIIDAPISEVVTLNRGTSGTPSVDAAIEVDRGSSANASLRWDETLGTWIIGLFGQEIEVSDVDHTHASIKELGDVREPMTPIDGQVLTWNNGNSEWESADSSHAINIANEGSNLGTFNSINFIGASVVDGGGGEADVTVSAGSSIRPTFCIFAEENSGVSVSANNYEYSFGNGAVNNTVDPPGIPMGVNCTLIGIGVSSRNTISGTSTISISVTRNGTVVGTSGIASSSVQNTKCQIHSDITPDTVDFVPGDTLQFLTASATGTHDDVRVVAWFERTS